MYSNTVKSACDILTDRGYEFQVSMYDKLRELEEMWDDSVRLTADILAEEYHRRYHSDLNHAVFVLKTPIAERENIVKRKHQ